MKKSMLFIMAVMIISAMSCTSREVTRTTRTEEPTFGLRQQYPVYHLINGKIGFEFHDKQDMLKSLKRANTDSVLLSRTTIIHSYLDGNNFFGEWVIPAHQLVDTTYQEIDGVDTMTVIVETMEFSLKNYRLKEYKEDRPY